MGNHLVLVNKIALRMLHIRNNLHMKYTNCQGSDPRHPPSTFDWESLGAFVTDAPILAIQTKAIALEEKVSTFV